MDQEQKCFSARLEDLHFEPINFQSFSAQKMSIHFSKGTSLNIFSDLGNSNIGAVSGNLEQNCVFA
jgi:hypothetical protein